MGGGPGGGHALEAGGVEAAGEDAFDEPDVDDLDLECLRAGEVGLLGAVAPRQPEQPIDLAHLGPGQRVLEDCFGVGADVRAVARGAPGEPVEVAQRVGRDLIGQVSGVGVPATGLLAGMDLEQLPAVIELHRGGVGAGDDAGGDQLAGHAVERPGHFDVTVAGDLGLGEDRDRERPVRGRAQQLDFLGGEHLGGASPGAAVDPGAGHLGAPALGAGPTVGQVEELLAGEEVPAHVLHGALDAGLVLRVPDPCRVDDEAPGLGVLAERVVEPGIGRIGLVHHRFEVVGDGDGEHTAEKRPRGVEPGDDLGEGLAVGGEDEQVPRVDRGEDQPLDHPPVAAGRVRDQPEATEVDLHLRAGVAIDHRDRRAAASEPELGDREAVQRAVGHRHPAPLE